MNNQNNINNIIIAHKITTVLLKSYFSSFIQTNKVSVLISVPTFKFINPGVLQVQVFYYISGFSGISHLSDSSKKTLSISIAAVYPTTIQVELQLVQQNQPYINASILAQYLAINASKYGFHRIITILFSSVPYYNPSTTVGISTATPMLNFCITGLKVQLSGLLTTQRNRARKTVYTAKAGTFHSSTLTSSHDINIYDIGKINVDFAQSTTKSREGAFNIKVFISSIPHR